jgi:hypothetical protein
VGLIRCLKGLVRQHRDAETADVHDCCSCDTAGNSVVTTEIAELEEQLRVQRQMEWADYNVVVSCECCLRPND